MIDNVSEVLASSTAFFEEAYMFGSALWSKPRNDIDILLVYDRARLWEVEAEKTRLEAELWNRIGDVAFHFTTLNRTEMKHTNFLGLVRYEKLK